MQPLNERISCSTAELNYIFTYLDSLTLRSKAFMTSIDSFVLFIFTK